MGDVHCILGDICDSKESLLDGCVSWESHGLTPGWGGGTLTHRLGAPGSSPYARCFGAHPHLCHCPACPETWAVFPVSTVGGPRSLSQASPELPGHACQPCALKVAVHASCVRMSFPPLAHRSAHGRGVPDRRRSWRCDARGGALHGVVLL